MLKVTVAEVKRNVLKQLGIQVTGSWTVGGSTFGFAGTNPLVVNPTGGATPLASGIGLGQVGDQQSNLVGAASTGAGSLSVGSVRALETQGVFRTLAEPTLTAVSGESARFLAGGELPIPTENCEAGRCTVSVEFKPSASHSPSRRLFCPKAASRCAYRPK